MRKIKMLVSFITAAMLIFTFAGCSRQTLSGSGVLNIKTTAADRHKIQTALDVAGVLVPNKTVNIACKISGQVTDMGFDVGDTVKANDVLIALETKTLNAQLQQAKTGLKSAEVAAQSARNQSELAKINLDTAQKAYNDTKALYDANAVPKSQLQDVTNKLELAQKQYENAAGSAQDQAQAAIGTANANINAVKVQIENSIIRSPISGIVINRNINPGEIAASNVSLMTIADTSSLKLKGTVPQEALPLLQTGQEINVSIDIYPDKLFKGKIESIGPIAISTGVLFPIEITLENSDGIKAGLSAHASIDISEEKGVIVPECAVVWNSGESYVFVVKDNIISKRVVSTGLKNEKEIEIIKGLNEGELVAVTNVNSLFDNMRVSTNR